MTATAPYVFVFTGTSGSGRKTTAHRALKDRPVVHVPSCTDRPPRLKEHPDSDYRYVSSKQFDLMMMSNFFAETVTIDSHRYGIGKRYLDMALDSGKHVYVILNCEGSEVIRSLYGPRVIRIFMYVYKNTIKERLETKGFPYEVIDSYLSHYNHEVAYRKNCEHVIENLTLDRTIEQIRTIVDSYIAPK